MPSGFSKFFRTVLAIEAQQLADRLDTHPLTPHLDNFLRAFPPQPEGPAAGLIPCLEGFSTGTTGGTGADTE